MKLLTLVSLAAAVSELRAQTTGLAPKKYLTIPLGKIQPTGWLMDQLKVQTNGLAGHEHEFYNYVAQTDWMGGNSFYSNLEEAGSYWFNAMVPNGILVNNSATRGSAAFGPLLPCLQIVLRSLGLCSVHRLAPHFACIFLCPFVCVLPSTRVPPPIRYMTCILCIAHLRFPLHALPIILVLC